MFQANKAKDDVVTQDPVSCSSTLGSSRSNNSSQGLKLERVESKFSFLELYFLFLHQQQNKLNDSQCMKFKVNAMSLILIFIFNNVRLTESFLYVNHFI